MRIKLLQESPEKTYAVVFETSEEVVEGLLRFADEQQVASAHITGIGAFENVVLGFFDPDRRDYEQIAINEQLELLSLAGNLARDDKGRPRLHAHVVVAKRDGTAHGGHLLRASVRPTMEIVIVESSKSLRRRMDDKAGAALLDLSN